MDTSKDSSTPVPGTDEQTGAIPPVAAADTQEKKGQDDATLGDMPSIFNTTKPRSLYDGLGNGLGNVLKGIITSPFLSERHFHRLMFPPH